MAIPSPTSTAHTTPSPTPTLSRINLLDNTIPAVSSLTPSPSDENLPSAASSAKAPGRRKTLQKAIAQRKYRRWGTDPFPGDGYLSDAAPGSGESPDPRAAGVVERVGEDEETVAGGSLSGALGGGTRGRERSSTERDNRKTDGAAENKERRTGKKKDEKEKVVAEIDILYENQRGMFTCGIPLFSAKGLLNFDPAPWQNAHYYDSAVSIVDAQVPDPSWIWAWKTWYVDMTADVDEEGWTYSFSFNPAFSWHGTHIWFHSFVRRRRWLRKRVKLHGHENGSVCSSRDGSRERGHGLNQDYFTIHSHSRQTNPGRSMAVCRKKGRDAMGGEGWSWKDEDGDGKEDSEQAEREEIKDIPMLMNALRAARLDREKVAAVESFLREGGEEVEYLAEKIPTIMALMIFQASRRQLLSLLIEEAEAEAAKRAELSPVPPPAPLPPTLQEPITQSSQVSGSPHPPPAVLITDEIIPAEPTDSSENIKARLKRKIKALESSIVVAEGEVRKMEYWSDIAGASADGETTLVVDDDLGLGGAPFTSGVGSSPGKSVAGTTGMVDRKGKGRDTSV